MRVNRGIWGKRLFKQPDRKARRGYGTSRLPEFSEFSEAIRNIRYMNKKAGDDAAGAWESSVPF
jgi:hypothetical protein